MCPTDYSAMKDSDMKADEWPLNCDGDKNVPASQVNVVFGHRMLAGSREHCQKMHLANRVR
jgi:hypothetical protein